MWNVTTDGALPSLVGGENQLAVDHRHVFKSGDTAWPGHVAHQVTVETEMLMLSARFFQGFSGNTLEVCFLSHKVKVRFHDLVDLPTSRISNSGRQVPP